MKTKVYDGLNGIEVTATNPTSPASGAPLRVGGLTGVALANEGEGGVSAATKTMVDFGGGIYSLSVTDHAGGGIAIGDPLFYVDGAGDAAGTIENDATGYFFGYAMATVAAGQTATIQVLRPGATGQALGAGNVATANLANDAVTNDKIANMARGTVKVGGVGNAPTDLDANDSGKILVGDGTDVVSVAVSGDATLSSAGAVAVKQYGVSAKGTVVPHAANAAIDAADVAKIHTNTGAGGKITLTLPAAAGASGKNMRVQITAAQAVDITPAAGEKVYLGGDGVADKYCEIAGVIGNYAHIYCDGTDWLVIDYSGVVTKQA